jgi:transcription elongation factor Elf1
MDGAWRCPACQTVIVYKDYDAANSGKIFPCRTCGLSLIIDREADQPVVAPKPSAKPPGTRLTCPHCQSTNVQTISLRDDHRTVTIKCARCARISVIPDPPLSRT